LTNNNSILNSSVWVIFEKIILQLVQLIVGLILARKLGPEAFGMIALTTIFITIASAIADGGFEKTIIQSLNIDNTQLSTFFFINLLISFLLATLVYLLSPFLARYLNEPNFEYVLTFLTSTIVINSLTIVHRALLLKAMNFKILSKIQIVNSLTIGISGVVLAHLNYGVWSLVWSTILGAIVNCFSYWSFSKWKPKIICSFKSIQALLPFSFNTLGGSILFFLSQQISNIIIGKNFGSQTLGLYNRGMKFPELVFGVIQNTINRLTLPVFSKIQYDISKSQSLERKATDLVAVFTIPISLFMYINADNIILIFLNREWIGSVVFLKIFSIVKVFENISFIKREILLALGKSKILLRILVTSSVLEIFTILIFLKSGAIVISIIILTSKIIQTYFYNLILNKLLLVNSIMWDQLRLYLALSILICIILLIKYSFGIIELNPVLSLLISFILIPIVLLTILKILKIKNFDFLISNLKNRISIALR
jgi:teichuronic acid exporter